MMLFFHTINNATDHVSAYHCIGKEKTGRERLVVANATLHISAGQSWWHSLRYACLMALNLVETRHHLVFGHRYKSLKV